MWQFLIGWAVTMQLAKEVQVRVGKGGGVLLGKKFFLPPTVLRLPVGGLSGSASELPHFRVS